QQEATDAHLVRRPGRAAGDPAAPPARVLPAVRADLIAHGCPPPRHRPLGPVPLAGAPFLAAVPPSPATAELTGAALLAAVPPSPATAELTGAALLAAVPPLTR